MKTIFSLFLIVAISAVGITPATAQDTQKIPRIGILSSRGAGFTPGLSRNQSALLQGLEELGYVDGKNIRIEFRTAKGKLNLLPGLAAELVRLNVAGIVPSGPTAVGPAMKATKTIPIVMPNGGKPVERGFVKSLIRPDGNVTGLAGSAEGLNYKQIELLKETSSSVKRVVVLIPHRRRESTGDATRK